LNRRGGPRMLRLASNHYLALYVRASSLTLRNSIIAQKHSCRTYRRLEQL